MIILRQKEYSFKDKFKAGGKSAWTGAKLGAILAPGNIITLLCGKKKAALILTAIGSGIGAGIGFYYGWKGQKKLDDFNEQLKSDPKLQAEKKKELEDYIKESINRKADNNYNFEKICKESDVPLRPDFYDYLRKYRSFEDKYRKEWVNAWKNLNRVEEIDEEFNIVFPEPFLDEDYDRKSGSYIAANGFAPSDHFWILWDSEREEYNNNLGSGIGTGKTLIEACKNFAGQWIVDENKIDDPGIKEVAKIHNKIIKEFLKL